MKILGLTVLPWLLVLILIVLFFFEHQRIGTLQASRDNLLFENGTLSGYIQQLEQRQTMMVKRFIMALSSQQSLKQRGSKDTTIPSIWPTEGTVSSLYGMRRDPFTKKFQFHSGIDIANFKSTDVLSTARGKVDFAGPKSGYGNAVIIDHGNGYKTLYGHCDRILVAKGDRVDQKMVIAAMGSTGRSTGDHLHYEVIFAGEPLDPTMFVE